MLATITVLSKHVRSLQRNHELSLQQALDAAQREAEINRELFAAEQRYGEARELALHRERQLASASHDIRQPLVSLRATVDSLADDHPAPVRQQLTNALEYLDDLCKQYLSETGPDEPAANTPEARAEENYPLNLLIDTAFQMFSEEAADKGIRLSRVPSSATTSVTPMVLMRMYSNLLSNALKHSAAERILLGVRRHSSHWRLQVIDNGMGIGAEQLARVRNAYQRGEDSDGSGLGLAICEQMAVEHQLEFEISSSPGSGTLSEIRIPREIPGG
jgi:signal transduction histidine kinase